MRTEFTADQLSDPAIHRSNEILRSCVHCGMCTATCPTYLLLGDELDSPRGRIYLIKQMLEQGQPADTKTVLHIDRCLSCLSCMTTCPSGVHYMHLVDYAREYIEKTYTRPVFDRILRGLLGQLIPYPKRFRFALYAARMGKPFRRLMFDSRLRAMLDMAPSTIPPPSYDRPQIIPAHGTKKWRVALMTGCAQQALNTNINKSTINLLTKLGCEVVISKGSGCCGALTHHMGKSRSSKAFARANIKAWSKDAYNSGLDAIIINASGCGTTVKDYGHMFRDDELADDAYQVSDLTMDITEFLDKIGYPKAKPKSELVCYHSACSLQHGQKIKELPKKLLQRAGYEVHEPTESHICCGSAGTYNLLQPELSEQLRIRKTESIKNIQADIVATGNIGCMMQLERGLKIPVVHTVELLDQAFAEIQ